MSLFSDDGLLAREAEALRARGGPEPRAHHPARRRLSAGRAGDLSAGSTTAPVAAAATALVGACMHHAFVGSFSASGQSGDNEQAFTELADGVVAAVLDGICP